MLKFVSGADSFDFGVSYTFWGNQKGFQEAMGGFDPYYLGILIFVFFSIYFSFGNIENAKTLQMVTTILRFVVTTMMCIGSLYYIAIGKTEGGGINHGPIFDFKEQMPHLAKVFGNTTFVFIYHHSVSGIIYPIRP